MKYGFTGETREFGSVTLYQIVAIESFGSVKKGDIGGWVESEENLSQDGKAWVFAQARVFDNAVVRGNAQVFGDARVYGDARVSGNAQVYGGAWVKSPLYIQGTKYSVCMQDTKKLKIGCTTHTIKGWLRHGRKIGETEGFTPEEIEEYMLYVELADKLYPSR